MKWPRPWASISLAICSLPVPTKQPLHPLVCSFPNVFRHSVINERIESLSDDSLAVDDRSNVSHLLRLIGWSAVPDLVMKHYGIAGLREKWNGRLTIKGWILARVRIAPGEVAAGNYFRDSIPDGGHIAQREKDVENQTGRRHTRVVLENVIW